MSSDRFTPYENNSRGTSNQGNDYDTRTQPAGEAYHYSNQDGSYYYSNGDGSKYHNDGQGSATYTAPDGVMYDKSYANEESGTVKSDSEVSQDEALDTIKEDNGAIDDASSIEGEQLDPTDNTGEVDDMGDSEEIVEEEEDEVEQDEVFYSDPEDFDEGYDDDGGYQEDDNDDDY